MLLPPAHPLRMTTAESMPLSYCTKGLPGALAIEHVATCVAPEAAHVFHSVNAYEADSEDGKTVIVADLTWANGERYEGVYVTGQVREQGVFTRANGERYEGVYWDKYHYGCNSLV